MLKIWYAWHGKHDAAMQLIHINRSRNPGQANYVGVAFSTDNFKCLLARHIMERVRYFNIKRSGENLGGVPKYSACMWGEYAYLSRHDMMQGANKCMDVIFMFFTFF
jgi:hypothetical protein